MRSRAARDPLWLRVLFFSMTGSFMVLFLILPVVVVLLEAFRNGLSGYWQSLTGGFDTSDVHTWSDFFTALWTTPSPTLSAIRMTLEIAVVVVPVNTIFGIAAAWLVTHFRFPGKAMFLTIIELPLWISPVIGGLMFVLLFGSNGWFGPWLIAHDFQILYAFPGMAMATAFVTFPFVARSLIPLMQSLGSAEEEAALTLGANAWQMFWRVTFPKIRWGVLYGVILCNARAMGEFGAVSVVSGGIVGQTLTMPLQIEQYFQGVNSIDAFVLASLLLILALVSLVIKTLLEWWQIRPQNNRNRH